MKFHFGFAISDFVLMAEIAVLKRGQLVGEQNPKSAFRNPKSFFNDT